MIEARIWAHDNEMGAINPADPVDGSESDRL
jgi:hypothetical protein